MTIPIPLGPDAIDAAWLATALGHPEDSIRSVERSLVGTGQMGRNYRFALDWASSSADRPESVVVKLPSDDPKSRAAGSAQGSYAKEVRFYRDVVETVDIRTPRCHHAAIAENGIDFVLVMEDMAPARQGDQIAGCSVDEAWLAVSEASKLHAPRWNDPKLEQIEGLGRATQDTANLLQAMYMALFPGFAERFSARLAPEHMACIEALGPRLAAWILARREPFTLLHGDYRLDNMLFGGEGAAAPLAVVDWQTLGLGVGAGDVAYFLGAGLDPSVRAAEERAMVESYHADLVARGVTGYDFDACWRDYRHTTVGGIIVTVVASMIVEVTERGDEMFTAMASRHAQHALDLQYEKALD